MKRILLVLAIASTAYADDTQRAKTYYQAGVKAYAAQNFAAAASDFDEAYKAAPVPEVAFSAAQAYRRLYRVDPKPEYVARAVELYKAYLDKVKQGGRVGDAADSLGEMQRELDRLGGAARVATVAHVERTRLGVNVAFADRTDTAAMKEVGDATGQLVAGLHATLDGKDIEPFALVDVAPGDHAIAVTADGYVSAQRPAHAVAGASDLLDVVLVPKPAVVKVSTEDGATVSVDGRIADVPQRIELPAGKHFVLVTRRGREPFAREVSVTRGQAVAVDAPLEHTQKRKLLPWAIGATGVLALATLGSVIGAVGADNDASKLYDQIRGPGGATPAQADRLQKDIDHRDQLRNAAIGFGVATAVAGVVTLGLWYFDTPSAEGVHLAPMAGPGTAGAMVYARF